ncbi:MAG: hypothetical protein N3D12_02750 [Candidatus Methanomethyliaceae archaeon]|nr:hypothetical protein [Candidatus Methanomethyliaceae archaeon]
MPRVIAEIHIELRVKQAKSNYAIVYITVNVDGMDVMALQIMASPD